MKDFAPRNIKPRLVSWIIGVELIGITSSFFTIEAIDSWYQFLNKPAFSPPNWLFGPVWTILYAMMGTVGYWLWQTKKPVLSREKQMFAVQLFLNWAWSPVFFGLKRIDWALGVIVTLWVVLGLLIRNLLKKRSYLGWWLIPYFLWVSFALILNLSIWWLN